ncbi:MAG: OB-fold nucleic acid binding domain-containing protein, partial [Beijerinckiaceae bacterium]
MRLQKEHQAVGFYLSGHPLDDYARVLARHNIQTHAAFVQSVRAGATAGRLAASVLGRAERKTKSGAKLGIITLSDTSGQYEATLFAEKLGQYRDALDNGALVMLQVNASLDGDELRVRIQHVEPLDKITANQTASAKIYVRENCPIQSLLARLDKKGDGDVTVVALVDNGKREVEVRLPGHYRLTPQISGALRSVQGVVSVELV